MFARISLLLAAVSLSAVHGDVSALDAEVNVRDLAAEWDTVTEKACEGSEVQATTCKPQQECNPCIPEDCTFSEWGMWSEASTMQGGKFQCTELCERTRQVTRNASECGNPCSGALSQTSKCTDKTSCYPKPVDCTLGAWSDWTKCKSPLSQKTRTRKITSESKNGGKTCGAATGVTLAQSLACSLYTPTDCRYSDWGLWGRCSKTCEGGVSNRFRHIAKHATRMGKTCSDGLSEAVPCSQQSCSFDKGDCEMGQWADWSACQSSITPKQLSRFGKEVYGQRMTSRHIKRNAAWGFTPCSSELWKIEGCAILPKLPYDCKFSDWAKWGNCTTSCGSGQRTRDRKLIEEANIRGSCERASMSETRECDNPVCGKPANDCQISTWGQWSKCPECGEGSQQRNRKLHLAGPEGKPCQRTDLSQLQKCPKRTACEPQDCVWHDWSLWGKCSVTCGGGVTERYRSVAKPPRFGGKCENRTQKEFAWCGRASCSPPCKDGSWGDWKEWNVCSASCGDGYQSRHRTVAVIANDCGAPAVGTDVEYTKCTRVIPDCATEYPNLDCKLSEWAVWSGCSNTCRGVQTRNRVVKVYAHGTGESCDESLLKETRGCADWTRNPSAATECTGIQAPVDCVFGNWTGTSTCTASCGGGSLMKHRSYLAGQHLGDSCEGGLSKTVPCNTQACPNSDCVDCLWGDWSAWDACTSCTGQRIRRRQILQVPNYCGRTCKESDAVDIKDCVGTVACPDFLFCSWQTWSEWSACPSHCGNHAVSRTRVMNRAVGKPDSYLVKAQVGSAMTCGGSQTNRHYCSNQRCDECVPKDCKFSEWSPWDQQEANELCIRHRTIVQYANECGAKCQDILSDTKKCPVVKAPVDCILNHWSMWSLCAASADQSVRMRHVEQLASHGGKQCGAIIKETQPCSASKSVTPRNCQVLDWSSWGSCSKTCVGGKQERVRAIKEFSIAPGTPCAEDLREVRECDTGKNCDGRPYKPGTNCAFGAWNAWSNVCSGHNQRFRDRSMLLAQWGKACDGASEQTEACEKPMKVDCQLSQWTAWTACDTSCDVGMKLRYRQVQVHPENDGAACSVKGLATILKEVAPCNEDHPCADVRDCKVKDWTVWTPCTATCGAAQQMRSRDLQRRTLGGEGCTSGLSMSDARPCPSQAPCHTDCVWSPWTQWSDCSKTCGGGSRTHHRYIVVPPSPNGRTCNAHPQEEMKACNTQSCVAKCVDGKWNEWEEWTACSSTCKGGLRWQSRTILSEASQCGIPASGLAHRLETCNEGIACVPDVDCELSSWSSWGLCSATCSGIQDRSRTIAHHLSGKGASCKGSLGEKRMCSSPTGCTEIVQPCTLSDWQPFGACSVSCGSGQKTRARAVLERSKCSNVGLVETAGCNVAVCNEPVDCTWGDWKEWGECSACDGERHRNREFQKAGVFGGKLCKSADAAEVGKCPRSCHGKYLCSWAQWAEWSGCSKSCGTSGRRTRNRVLHLAESSKSSKVEIDAASKLWADEDMLEDKVNELYRRSQKAEAARGQQITIAFISGCLSLVLIFVVSRPIARRRNTSTVPIAVSTIVSLGEDSARGPILSRERSDAGNVTPRTLRLEGQGQGDSNREDV